jgi:hypothetical protein
MFAQTISNEFSLTSPFNEPDDRHDVVKLNDKDIVTLAKVKGNVTSKSDFVLERYNYNLQSQWKTPMVADPSEDYKDLFYNGKEVVLLSVIHKESEKKTTLIAYGFDPANGKLLWNKTLESYPVGEWVNHSHKGKVKESFTDVVCEHVNQSFVTPFEYKHNIHFSPDKEKFISYVFNYGEKNLTASLSVYDKSGNVLSKGKVSIDDNYINQGIYINNEGKVFILNSNSSGKLNVIRFDLSTKDFDILELPGSNFIKDDFHVHFISNTSLLIACSEQVNGVLMGVMYTRFDFEEQVVQESVFESINGSTGSKILELRKSSKLMKGEEDWKDYDITQFIVDNNDNKFIVLEKRHLFSDGYPHIGRDVFDASHKVEINGHVQAEGIIIFAFNKTNQFIWSAYLPKNQIYAASDGLNSVSFVLNEQTNSLKLIYAYSENMDGMLFSLSCTTIDKATGKKSDAPIPNDQKLIPVREYTTFYEDGTAVMVGKKGLLGKSSSIIRIKP